MRRDDDDRAVRRWKRRELIRIAARDLLGTADLPAVGRELAALASVCLDAALPCRRLPTRPIAIIGMGKLGGRELNYSSDVDVLFVHDGNTAEAERAARAVLVTMSDDLGGRHRVPHRCRTSGPRGARGALTRTIDSYAAYYRRSGVGPGSSRRC